MPARTDLALRTLAVDMLKAARSGVASMKAMKAGDAANEYRGSGVAFSRQWNKQNCRAYKSMDHAGAMAIATFMHTTITTITTPNGKVVTFSVEEIDTSKYTPGTLNVTARDDESYDTRRIPFEIDVDGVSASFSTEAGDKVIITLPNGSDGFPDVNRDPVITLKESEEKE